MFPDISLLHIISISSTWCTHSTELVHGYQEYLP